MRVFLTGASGFIGSAIVQELLGAGHQVLGLARSDTAANALTAAGARVHRGALDDPESLKRGAAEADGVIHTAFIHDFSNLVASGEADKRAIEAMGSVLAGTGRPLVITSGTALLTPGRLGTEEQAPDPKALPAFRMASEEVALSLASRGVRASVVRLPPSVHGDGDHGFVPILIGTAREKLASAYIGDGLNRWAAVHRLDAANLFRLALEKAPAGSRLHGVAEEGVSLRDIAQVIGARLNLPVVSKSREEAASHFGWFAAFAGIDSPASSARTREQLGWSPKQPSLVLDLERGRYFQS